MAISLKLGIIYISSIWTLVHFSNNQENRINFIVDNQINLCKGCTCPASSKT